MEALDLRIDKQIQRLESDFTLELEENMISNLEEKLSIKKKIYDKYPELIEKDVEEALEYLPGIC